MRGKMLRLLSIAMGIATTGYSAVLVSQNYEAGQIVGTNPTGASDFRPGTSTTNAACVVVDASTNRAGTGNGLRLLDDANDNGIRLSYDLVENAGAQRSTVRIDFSFAALNTTTSGGRFMVAVGAYGSSMTSGSQRLTDCRLEANGTIGFRSGTGPDSYGNGLLTSNNTVSIFINDLDDESVDYYGAGPSGVCFADEFSGLLAKRNVGADYTDGKSNHGERNYFQYDQ